MRYAIIYWSRYGNGKRAVEYLAGKLREREAEVQVLRTEEVDPGAMPEADLYVFSAPAEAFNVQVDMRNLMKGLRGMEGKSFGIINTHALKRNWLGKMEKLLSKRGMQMTAGVDLRVGDGTKEGQGLPEGWQARLDEFAARI